MDCQSIVSILGEWSLFGRQTSKIEPVVLSLGFFFGSVWKTALGLVRLEKCHFFTDDEMLCGTLGALKITIDRFLFLLFFLFRNAKNPPFISRKKRLPLLSVFFFYFGTIETCVILRIFLEHVWHIEISHPLSLFDWRRKNYK